MPADFSDRKVYIFSEFNEVVALDVISSLLYFDKVNNEPIKLYINSPGGSASSMFGIIDTMKVIKSPVYTIAIGSALSAGAFVFASGEKRFIAEKTKVMLHKIMLMFCGTLRSEEIDDFNKVMTEDNRKALQILADATGKPAEVIEEDLKRKEFYLTAPQAIDYGLADEILSSQAMETYNLSEKYSLPAEPVKLSENRKQLSDIPIMKAGKFDHILYGQFEITAEKIKEFKENFDDDVRGIELAIDTTHDNDNGEKPAVGWIKGLEVVGNGTEIRGKAEFTRKMWQKLADGEYKYFSPELDFNYVNEKGKKCGNVLLGGTLTNRPFMKGTAAIKLSEAQIKTKEKKPMTLEELKAKLKDEHKIDVYALQNSVKESDTLKKENEKLASENKALADLKKSDAGKLASENENLKGRVDNLETELNSEKKAKIFDTLVRDFKVASGQKEKVMKTFATAKDMEDFYAGAPSIKQIKEKGDGGNTDAELSTPEKANLIENGGKFTREQILGSRERKGIK